MDDGAFAMYLIFSVLYHTGGILECEAQKQENARFVHVNKGFPHFSADDK